jgi:hypothetical protein
MKIFIFLEQLYNALNTGYLYCGEPYVCSVHLVKIRINRLLQIKPRPLPPTALPIIIHPLFCFISSATARAGAKDVILVNQHIVEKKEGPVF